MTKKQYLVILLPNFIGGGFVMTALLSQILHRYWGITNFVASWLEANIAFPAYFLLLMVLVSILLYSIATPSSKEK